MYNPPNVDPVPEEKKSTRVAKIFGKRIVIYIVVAVVLGVGGLVYRQITGAPSTASVGDCMAGQSEDDLKVVECTEATAAWQVDTKVDDITEAAFNSDTELKLCTGSETTTAYWEGGSKGRAGYMLCLKPKK
jgi:hypothetical protein